MFYRIKDRLEMYISNLGIVISSSRVFFFKYKFYINTITVIISIISIYIRTRVCARVDNKTCLLKLILLHLWWL